jgi:hypothetical protein
MAIDISDTYMVGMLQPISPFPRDAAFSIACLTYGLEVLKYPSEKVLASRFSTLICSLGSYMTIVRSKRQGAHFYYFEPFSLAVCFICTFSAFI